jgi:prolipoprotein diacylglyceryltransferase
MGKRVLQVEPPAPVIRVALVLAALACYVIGGLWVLLFLGMLFFGGIDWREDVASGMSFQGPVIFGLAALGIFWFVGARSLMDRAAGRRRRPTPASAADTGTE